MLTWTRRRADASSRLSAASARQRSSSPRTAASSAWMAMRWARDLVLARAAGELEPLRQAGGGRRPVAAQMSPSATHGSAWVSRPIIPASRARAATRRCSSSTARSSHRKRPTGLTRPSRSGRLVRGRPSTSASVVRKRSAAASKSRVKWARRPAQAARAGSGWQAVRDPQALRPLGDGHDRVAVAREGRAPAGEAEQVQGALGVAGRDVVGRAGTGSGSSRPGPRTSARSPRAGDRSRRAPRARGSARAPGAAAPRRAGPGREARRSRPRR